LIDSKLTIMLDLARKYSCMAPPMLTNSTLCFAELMSEITGYFERTLSIAVYNSLDISLSMRSTSLDIMSIRYDISYTQNETLQN